MEELAVSLQDLRDQIISRPDVILDDRDIMRALIAANEKSLGGNIIDLRGIAIERLESRLERLEDTHRAVIAAAYENLSGTNRIHRAVLALLEPVEFEEFLRSLSTTVADVLRVDCVRLVLEDAAGAGAVAQERLGEVLSLVPPGYIDAYVETRRDPAPARKVTLRQVLPQAHEVYGGAAGWVQSEALIRLDFGPDTRPGLLAMGSEDPHQFRPNQGVDLLAFLGGVFERAMRRWLS